MTVYISMYVAINRRNNLLMYVCKKRYKEENKMRPKQMIHLCLREHSERMHTYNLL